MSDENVEMHRIIDNSYHVYDCLDKFKGAFDNLKKARLIRDKYDKGYIQKVWTEQTTITSRRFIR